MWNKSNSNSQTYAGSKRKYRENSIRNSSLATKTTTVFLLITMDKPTQEHQIRITLWTHVTKGKIDGKNEELNDD